MKVSEGKVGRVFVVRLEDGDRLPDTIEDLAVQKKIRAASVILLGASGGARLLSARKPPRFHPNR